jgi:chromosome partitioning protein
MTFTVPHDRGLILSVALLKGGVAKTTTAIALAYAASYGGTVVLADADPMSSACRWAELAAGSGRFRSLPFKVIPEASPDLERRVLRLARSADMVIVDSPPPGQLQIARAAIAAADYVVIPVTPEKAALDRVGATVDIARQLGKPVRAALTMVRAGLTERDSAIDFLHAADVPVFTAELPLAVSVQRYYGHIPAGILARFGLDLLEEILKEAQPNG